MMPPPTPNSPARVPAAAPKTKYKSSSIQHPRK
jgi:hypothetical protein